jgi:uncharacterized repeat protein (TIGR01451 family)
MRIALVGILLAGAATTATQAKSLYVITQIIKVGGDTPVSAYDIGPGGLLTYQTEYGIRSRGSGTVGLAIDSGSESLFVTYEGSNEIQVLDATTMQENLVAAAPGAQDLAGIVYDHDKELLYCVDRAEPNLYVYRWDPIIGRLSAVVDSPFRLAGAEAYGIALDEIDDQLYVGNASKQVTVYNTADWSLVRTISLHRPAISVAVDPKRNYLYTGGGFIGNTYLTQFNLTTGAEAEVEVDPDAGVMGLGVDPTTGCIYLTTGVNNRPGGDDLIVFNTSLNRIQTIEDIGNPTGLVIPGKETSYNPLHLTKTVEVPLAPANPGSVPEIPIGGEFTYSICFDHDGYALTNVVVIDTLPPEVAFVRADDDGFSGHYDSQAHTYTWTEPPLSAGPQTCLRVVVRLKPDIAVGTIVHNAVTIDTAQTPPTTITMDAVAAVIVLPFNPLAVTKMAVRGVDANDPSGVIYANRDNPFTYQICYDNRANTQPVTNVTVVDALPGELLFVSTNDKTGQYDPLTHTCTWSFPTVAAGETGCVELVVQVGRDVPGGTTVTNRVTIDSDETPATTATTAVVTALDPLGLTKRIRSGATADPKVRDRFLVNPGTDLTYEICLTNPSATHTVTEISIVDTLPAQVAFVSAEGDREIGYYDSLTHTYTWFYGSLAPGADDCLDLVVHVPDATEPNTVITNTVMISARQTQSVTTTVDVTVPNEPVEPEQEAVICELLVKPTKLYRDLPKQPTNLMAVLHLPDGYGKQLILNQPLILTPGNIPALNQTVFGTTRAGVIMAFFDPQALLAATDVNGDLDITVTGQLFGGQSFQGTQGIEIFPSSK